MEDQLKNTIPTALTDIDEGNNGESHGVNKCQVFCTKNLTFGSKKLYLRYESGGANTE